MNSHSDSRSRFHPKYSAGSVASSAFLSSFVASPLSSSITRLNPVPTGSTNTRSAKTSQDASFCTSRGGISGSVPSAGKATRCGPTTPRCRYAEDAPGPPLKTNITGRAGIVAVGDIRDGEDLRGRLLLLPQHQPLRARRVVDRRCSTGPGGGSLRPRRWLVICPGGRLLVLRALVTHGGDAS